MGVRIKDFISGASIPGGAPTEYVDTSFIQRETTYDGQTFHWAPNQTRNFMDDGVGIAHGAVAGGGDSIVQDSNTYGDSRS